MKKQIALILAFTTLLALSGCSQTNQQSAQISNLSTTTINTTQTNELTEEKKQEKEAFQNSTAENDTDLGLRNIKIDTAEYELSDAQKTVLTYFDNDYFYVSNDNGYEYLQRYPQVFQGTQLNFNGIVDRIISYSGDCYEIMIKLVDSETYYSYWNPGENYQNYLEQRAKNYVFVTGTSSSARLIEGDFVSVYGRYVDVNTVSIDGISFTIPQITVYRTDIIPNDVYIPPVKFDIPFVKTVAKAIFGNNIEVREPIFGLDVPPADEMGTMYEFQQFCIVELENQSNAKFTKYRFGLSSGLIEDAKTGIIAATPNFDIIRTLEFSSDFEHFLIFTYDTSLETVNLDYYDKDFNKIWNREFIEATSANYDYTKNNIYLTANNELFIINTQTGEDTFAPVYIGPKVEIRKLSDGILVISQSKSDGVMKLDLNGSLLWKTNLTDDVKEVNQVQLAEKRIVLDLELGDDSAPIGESRYLVLDSEDGSVIVDAISLN